MFGTVDLMLAQRALGVSGTEPSSRQETPLLAIAVIAMLGQQTIASVCKSGVPVLFKPIADSAAIGAELVLLYSGFFAFVGIFAMLGCGAFINRYGALRVSQFGCVSMAVGLALVALAPTSVVLLWLCLLLAAAFISCGSMAATPASSQILARYSPPRWAPLIFSVKQTGVPAGIAISGLAIPLLVVSYGWREAAMVIAFAAFAIGVGLQPCRAEFDADRRPASRIDLKAVLQTVLDVWAIRPLRLLALTCFVFVGVQAVFTTFTVVYLVETVDYSLASAGAALATASVVAAPTRIFWGWVASSFLRPATLLALLAVVMSIAIAAMGFFGDAWSPAAVMGVMIGVSLSALSWHGVFLSEVARLAPAGDAGRVTGGVLSFGTLGEICFPVLFGVGYWVAAYPGAYGALAIPPMLIGLLMLLRR